MPYSKGKVKKYGNSTKKPVEKKPKRDNSLAGRRKAEQDKKNMRR